MKEKLSFKQSVTVASMLFGMFFGAGNLIFPVHMGQLAGSNVWPAIIGFIITGVGLPLLGVAALGVSRSDGLKQLSARTGKAYSYFFTCALYLTIGPFFAIPRCATVPFAVGLAPLFPSAGALPLAVFTFVFFAVVLFFSLKPNGILTWIGKVLNPVFLVFLAVLVLRALISPLAPVSSVTPDASYQSGAFFRGFLEGYNTMDALAGLAFGIVVVNVIRSLGVNEPGAVAASTIRSGVFTCAIMAVIYIAVTVVGVQSRGLFDISENGGIALADISSHYFGRGGTVILTVTVTFACLKTAIGLVTSCAKSFTEMFPRSPGYRFWAILFSVFSFLIANVGLTAIIEYAIPVLMFLYPLAITLILLSLFGRFFGYDCAVYVSVTAFTLFAAIFDLIAALPQGVKDALSLGVVTDAAAKYLPLYSLGLGWICPAAVGLALGIVLHITRKSKKTV